MNAEDKMKLLLQEQAAFFRRGGVSLEKAREMGVGFLYDDGGPQQQEKEKEEEEAARQRPEDSIPDLPGNQAARDFLKKAPTKGLFMPLGKEVKVMQCWRCKQYGHRTGDKECPLFLSGNLAADAARQAREDPMAAVVGRKMLRAEEKEARRAQLEKIITDIRREEKEKKERRKRKRKETKKDRRKERKGSKKTKKKKREKERRRRRSSSSRSNSSSNSSSSSSSSSGSSSSSSESDKDSSHKHRKKHASSKKQKKTK